MESSAKQTITTLIKKYYPNMVILDCFDKDEKKISIYMKDLAEKQNDKLIMISNNQRILKCFEINERREPHDYFIIYRDDYLTFNMKIVEDTIKNVLRQLINRNNEECVICYEKNVGSICCLLCGSKICNSCDAKLIKLENNKCPICRKID